MILQVLWRCNLSSLFWHFTWRRLVVFADVSLQPIEPISMGQAIHAYCLTLGDGTDRLSRNVGKSLPRVGFTFFLDLGTRRGWVVSVTLRPLSTPGKDPVPIVQGAGWAPGPVWPCAKNLAPTGIRSPDRPARSQLLYRLSYPAHTLLFMCIYVYIRNVIGPMDWTSSIHRLRNNPVSLHPAGSETQADKTLGLTSVLKMHFSWFCELTCCDK
jgi:hypothetical protein